MIRMYRTGLVLALGLGLAMPAFANGITPPDAAPATAAPATTNAATATAKPALKHHGKIHHHAVKKVSAKAKTPPATAAAPAQK